MTMCMKQQALRQEVQDEQCWHGNGCSQSSSLCGDSNLPHYDTGMMILCTYIALYMFTVLY